MPSLIYIARVTHSSEELARRLKAAGFQVRSFGPGEITADECLLVMTSEAVLGGLHAANSEPTSAGHDTTGTELESTLGRLPDMSSRLGSQTAFRDSLKIVAAHKSITAESTKLRARAAVASTATGESVNPDPSKVASISPANGSPPAAATPSSENSALDGERPMKRLIHNLFWGPALLLGALLILAIGLLLTPTLNPSTDPFSAAQTLSGPLSASGAQASKSASPRPSADASKALDGRRRHPSDYDFVAEDFTNHFAIRTPVGAALQNPELKRHAQGAVQQKRIVVD